MFLNNIEKYIDSLHENTLDIELHITQSKYGNIYLMNEYLGQYRENVGVTFKNKFINHKKVTSFNLEASGDLKEVCFF